MNIEVLYVLSEMNTVNITNYDYRINLFKEFWNICSHKSFDVFSIISNMLYTSTIDNNFFDFLYEFMDSE